MPARTITVLPTSKGKATAQTTRVVLYARVSSKDQEKEGFSIPAQLRLLRDYAASKGFVITEEFTDVETAKVSGRTKFNEMLLYLKKHPESVSDDFGGEDGSPLPKHQGLRDHRRV